MNSGRKDGPRRLTEEEWLLWDQIRATVKPRRREEPLQDIPRSTMGAEVGSGKRPRQAEPSGDLRRPRTPLQPKNTPVAGKPSRLDAKTTRKLKRGRLAVDSRIDLHGMTQESAYGSLLRFLEAASRRGDRIVLVITGKGREGAGILRRAVPHWLSEHPLRVHVGSWAQAEQPHGGEGALYVRLRKRNPPA